MGPVRGWRDRWAEFSYEMAPYRPFLTVVAVVAILGALAWWKGWL